MTHNFDKEKAHDQFITAQKYWEAHLDWMHQCLKDRSDNLTFEILYEGRADCAWERLNFWDGEDWIYTNQFYQKGRARELALEILGAGAEMKERKKNAAL